MKARCLIAPFLENSDQVIRLDLESAKWLISSPRDERTV